MALDDFRPSGFFVFRTALLPFDELLAWSAGVLAPQAAGGDAAVEAWNADMAMLRERLRGIMQRPEVRESIFLASPDLEEQARPWIEGRSQESGAELALVRYLVRMAGRSTPFGLFAGNSVGRLEPAAAGAPSSVGGGNGGATAPSGGLRLVPRSRYRRHTRLDMDYLSVLVEALRGDAQLRRELVYRVNSSLHRVAGRGRYAEARLVNRERRYHLVAVDLDEPLLAVLDRAQAGASYDDLVGVLVSDDIAREEVEAYLDELIAAQLLVPDLEPAVTGPEALADLLGILEKAPSGARITSPLAAAGHELDRLDGEGVGVDPTRYRDIATALAALPAKAELARLFQVDLVKPIEQATLPPAVLEDMSAATVALLRLHADVMVRETEAFTTFRQQFTDRYGEREVALLEALDEEVGIGFMASSAPTAEASPLLNGLVFPATGTEQPPTWTNAQGFILPFLTKALQQGSHEIELTPADLEPLPKADPARLPDAFSLMAKVLADGPEGLASGNYRVSVENAGGPSGARLLGRFCPMDDELCEQVRQHLLQEEALVPDVVFAEIVHLPQGRIGNVIARPLLRTYELPYLGRSGAPAEHQIALQDLLISVVGNRIVLRSQRLGKEVIPRLTTAHNFSFRALGVYHFLCRLQMQHNVGGLAWNWGAMERLPFLPAIRVGRVVLAHARWRLERKQLEALGKAKGAQRFAAVQQLRGELRMPRFVGLVDGDNVLPIDLDNALCVETLVDLVEKRPSCTLREIEGSLDELLAQGPEGRFVHEIVLPLVRTSSATSTEAKARGTVGFRPAPADAGRLGPGSPWVYFKLYTGTSTADAILREELPELVAWAQQTAAVDRWFFIRYNEQGFHLRVRLRTTSPAARQELRARTEQQFASLVERGLVWRLQLDTYDPELARYGGQLGLDLAERLFHVDSEFVLRVMRMAVGDEGADLRWRLCLLGMDRLLDDLGFDLAGKHRIAMGVASDFGREFRVESDFKRQVRDRFRAERSALDRLLFGRNGVPEGAPEAPRVRPTLRPTRWPRARRCCASARRLWRRSPPSCALPTRRRSYGCRWSA